VLSASPLISAAGADFGIVLSPVGLTNQAPPIGPDRLLPLKSALPAGVALSRKWQNLHKNKRNLTSLYLFIDSAGHGTGQPDFDRIAKIF
jgi:hypothetical protein